MLDSVRFAVVFGPIGTSVERLVLGRYLRDLIVRRGRFL